ncbi:MAG: MoaD/ThiS family protein [Chloroflexi bacterium]|nr:MoaD/ThiS family protein [Chloroflexota bacterium]
MTHVTVELFGMSRLLAGQTEVELDLAGGSSLRDALAALAQEHAALVGPVLAPNGGGLHPCYALSLNGRSFAPDLDATLGPGDRVLILSTPAGG